VLWDAEIETIRSRELRELARRAADATHGAFAKYSHFRVGAALRLSSPSDLTGEERIVTATNVENGSYGLTSCAERNAIFRAVAAYGKGIKFDAIALVAWSRKLHPELPNTVSPCGACRQVLNEFKVDGNARVLFPKKGRFTTMTMKQLLPFPFELVEVRKSPDGSLGGG